MRCGFSQSKKATSPTLSAITLSSDQSRFNIGTVVLLYTSEKTRADEDGRPQFDVIKEPHYYVIVDKSFENKENPVFYANHISSNRRQCEPGHSK